VTAAPREDGALARVLLAPLSLLWSAVTSARNSYFDRRRGARLAVPVVSVGNLSVGGTGKTPLVVHLVELAVAAGRRPGVLARGYGRGPGADLNDEGLLLACRFPGLLQVQDQDRVRGGMRLLALGADYVIVDDGFQHRRLHRDVDLVCLDAAHPFTQVLPWRQRERAAGLRRASAVVLTRADAVAPGDVDAVTARVRQHAGRALPVFTAVHAPLDVVAQPSGVTQPLTVLRERAVVLLSAIARPDTFTRTVTDLGARVLGHIARRDHHRFTAAEVEALARDARARDAALLVTEKDDVKLAGLSVERLVLRIAMRVSPPLPDSLLRLTKA
jgi:tetraacyldisaccharide 4'-kinase